MNNAIKRIEKAQTAILRDPETEFFGLLLMGLRPLTPAPPECTTVCTDGVSIWWDEAFAASLNDDALRTPLGEEVFHIYSEHMFRAPPGARDSDESWRNWNLACDQEARWAMQEINDRCKAQNRRELFPWPKPEDAPQAEFKGQAAESVYATLRARKPSPAKGNNPNQPPQSGGDSSPGAPGKGQPTLSNGKANGNGTPQPSPEPPAGMADFAPPPASAAEAEHLRNEIRRAVLLAAQTARGMRHLPAGVDRIIQSIVAPARDPFTVLREWLTEVTQSDYDWQRPNRRYLDSGFFLPSLHSTGCGVVVLARDTSGSIDDTLLAKMRGVMQYVLDDLHATQLVVVDCDAAVQRVQVFEPGSDVALTDRPGGGGGTAFAPVFKLLAGDDTGLGTAVRESLAAVALTEVRALVCLTDLDGWFPKEPPEYPVFWATWEKTHRTPPFGEVINIA